ncbi:MAG: alkane 1-monooxygenase [Flavobacteriales bacterium]
MKKLKYLSVFSLPICVWISFNQTGLLVFLPAIVYFGAIPFLELVLKMDPSNLSEQEKELAKKDPFYTVLLCAMLPIQWGFLVFFFTHIEEAPSTMVLVGRILSMGIMSGVIGINIGHELGHRSNRFERWIGELLLLSSLENHFVPYHNRGHHTNVGTKKDPATARRNECVYLFWFRSQIGSYFQAWQIENTRMDIMKKNRFSLSNKMILYTLLHVSLLYFIYFFFGMNVLIYFLYTALIGILLLETVNYIEHYGLFRQARENGTFETVKRKHSWNSNHVIGRVVLFELSRHSDHHFKADRPFQLLESTEESPVMPTGYPGMMLLTFIPPLFFKIMNPRVDKALE